MTAKVYLKKTDSARQIKLEKISFFLAGFILLLTSYDTWLNNPPNDFFRYIYILLFILAGGLNIFAGMFNTKLSSPDKIKKLNRFIFTITGILLLLDSADKFVNKKTGVSIAIAVSAILYFTLALYQPALEKRRFLSVTKEGIEFRKRMRKYKKKWSDITHLTQGNEKLEIKLTTGKVLTFFYIPDDGVAFTTALKEHAEGKIST